MSTLFVYYLSLLRRPGSGGGIADPPPPPVRAPRLRYCRLSFPTLHSSPLRTAAIATHSPRAPPPPLFTGPETRLLHCVCVGVGVGVGVGVVVGGRIMVTSDHVPDHRSATDGRSSEIDQADSPGTVPVRLAPPDAWADRLELTVPDSYRVRVSDRDCRPFSDRRI